jgi:hypothetical protein
MIGTVALLVVTGGLSVLLRSDSTEQAAIEPIQASSAPTSTPPQPSETTDPAIDTASTTQTRIPSMTATEYIVTTPSPSILKSGRLLFQEDFNGNKNQWPTGTDGGDTYYIDAGEYHIVASERNASGVFWLAPTARSDQNFADFYLEVRARVIEGIQTDDSWGVLFRYSDDTGPYNAVISNAKQNYSVHTDEPILWWTYSPRIIKNEANTLGIQCAGDTITMYINGTKVDSIQSEFSGSGGIGLDYAAGEHVAFDYIYVWELPK